MNYKKTAGYVILLLALAGFLKAGLDIYGDIAPEGRGDQSTVIASGSGHPEGPTELVIYFFEGNAPCPVCEKIRGMTYELFQTDPEKLSLFSIRDVNVEEKGNERYVLELELFSTSVVLVEESEGRIYRWKNLTGVWDLAGDVEAFRYYMLREIEAFQSVGEGR